MISEIDELISQPQFTLSNSDREKILTPLLIQLQNHHRENCSIFERIYSSNPLPNPVKLGIAALPYLPVRSFKELELKSIPDEEVIKLLTSSGTTGQQVSKIYLDAEGASRQQRALSSVMTTILGPERLPMLIVDSKHIITNRKSYSARAAGVLGLMNFGKGHTWLLDESMNLDKASLISFLNKYGNEPFLIFGFTFMVWKYLLQELTTGEIDLSNGILVHSGGWKKLEDEAVSIEEFNSIWKQKTGLQHTRNFYGMVEQIGSIFVEGKDGWLHCPNFADVIIRNPEDWSICEPGVPGVIEVVSVLPTSYPGNVLLTEDIGVYSEVEDNEWKGTKFKVLGRLPKAELRGCSDTHIDSAKLAK